MSYYVSTSLPGGETLSTRVGTNCSEFTMLAMALAGYSVARLPDSRRVRRGWLSPAYDAARRAGVTLPIATGNVAGMLKLIATNDRGLAWIDLDRESIARGLRLKPVKCPALRAWVDWYEFHNGEGGYGNLPAEAVKRVSSLLDTVVPRIKASTAWHAQMEEVRKVFAAAAAAGATVHCG